MATTKAESITAEIRDLGSRLYYCSNTGEGRKVRRWIEAKIRALENEYETLEFGDFDQ